MEGVVKELESRPLSTKRICESVTSHFRKAISFLESFETSLIQMDETQNAFLNRMVEGIEAIYKTEASEKKLQRTKNENGLPKSILANQLPYLHQPWRKKPFEKR